MKNTEKKCKKCGSKCVKVCNLDTKTCEYVCTNCGEKQ
jgi:hypothetical protein